MHVLQVHLKRDEDTRVQLLKERNELADQVNRLEGELAVCSAEASYMHERFTELAAEVAAPVSELETANTKVAEVESKVAALWSAQMEIRGALCGLKIQMRALEGGVAELQQGKVAAEVRRVSLRLCANVFASALAVAKPSLSGPEFT